MLIPVLHLEESVQTDDLTRFDASKSIATKGADPITSVKIEAGYGVSEVEVFDPDTEARVLDWVFTSQVFDIDDNSSLLKFKVGNVDFSTNIAIGAYATLAALLLEVKNVIEALASPLTVTFTVEKDSRIKLAPSDPSFSLVLNKDPASLFDLLQFKTGVLTSEPVEFSLRAVKLTVASTSETASVTKYIKLFTPQSDRLFSSDADLVAKERDILKYVADGRASFLAEHRAAQNEILEWLYSNGIYDKEGKRLTKWSIVHTQELNQWATYKALTDLYLSFSNAVDDVFREKSENYDKYQVGCQNKFKISIDTDGDGAEDDVQDVSSASGTLVHR